MTIEVGKKPRNIRSRNKMIVFEHYRQNDKLSVAELAQKVRLSRTTIMKINQDLYQDGLIEDAGKGPSTGEGGKKPTFFRMSADYPLTFCFYIQYTSIRLTVFNLRFEIVFAKQFKIRPNEPIQGILKIIRQAYVAARSKYCRPDQPPLAMAVALHGVVDTKTGICRHSTHFPSWGLDLPLKHLVQEAITDSIPVYVDSWIRYRAIAEKEHGHARNKENYILINAGWHGITAGIIISGELFNGNQYLAGEIGHIVLSPLSHEICKCGGRGCFESLISCRRLVEKVLEQKQAYPESSIFKGEPPLELETIFRAADQGDTLARLLMDNVIQWFAVGISNICLVIDPQVVILEGDYSNAGEYFQTRLNEELGKVSMLLMKRDFNLKINRIENLDTTSLGAAAWAIKNSLHRQNRL